MGTKTYTFRARGAKTGQSKEVILPLLGKLIKKARESRHRLPEYKKKETLRPFSRILFA